MRHKKGVYLIANWQERKCYVGSSIRIEERLGGHKGLLRRGKHHSKRLQADWDRLGEDCFQFIIWEEINDDALINERERFWIEKFQGKKHYNTGVPGDRVYAGHLKLTGLKTSSGWIRRGDTVVVKGKKETIESINLHLSPAERGRFNIFHWLSRNGKGGKLERLIDMPEKYVALAK